MSDQMEAGPELDVLIAEKVMGWKLSPKKTDGVREFGSAWLDENGAVTRFQEDRRPPYDWDMKPFSPSTDIDAAWEVVEKLKLSLVPTNKGWIVSQHHLFEGPFGEGETAPLAICRAALAAIAWLANCVPKEEGPKP
jgi:hypothetical protein